MLSHPPLKERVFISTNALVLFHPINLNEKSGLRKEWNVPLNLSLGME